MNVTNDTQGDVETLAAANNCLGFRLLPQLVEPESGENVVLSPWSVALALAMTYNGAEGATKRAMAEVLGTAGWALEDVNRANAALLTLQEALDPQVQLAVANALWTAPGVEPAPDFRRRIQERYAATVATLDFAAPDAAATINRWVARETKDRIEKLVTPGDLQQALLVLTNAVHFKGLWTVPFDEANTEERDFIRLDGSRQRHPMMTQSGRYAYYEDEHLQAVSLPYDKGRVDMVVILPRPALPIAEFLAALTAERWQAWTHQFYEMEGEIVLPRFKVTYGADLLSPLVTLGGEAFAGPDFLGMGAGPLIIGQVIHKTFLEVNEEGTEAAAATAVVMRKSLVQPFRMVVDRPFFCAIRDRETGALLFMGLVLDPTAI